MYTNIPIPWHTQHNKPPTQTCTALPLFAPASPPAGAAACSRWASTSYKDGQRDPSTSANVSAAAVRAGNEYEEETEAGVTRAETGAPPPPLPPPCPVPPTTPGC